MIRRNSLRTRMASQFGSRISLERDVDDILAFHSYEIKEILQELFASQERALEEIVSTPEFSDKLDALEEAYLQKFGHKLAGEKFAYAFLKGQQLFHKNIIMEEFSKLRLGKAPKRAPLF